MTVKFIRVLGRRAKDPIVIAVVDGFCVRWTPKNDWTCECDERDFPDCPHATAVEDLLDPRVTAEPKRREVVVLP